MCWQNALIINCVSVELSIRVAWKNRNFEMRDVQCLKTFHGITWRQRGSLWWLLSPPRWQRSGSDDQLSSSFRCSSESSNLFCAKRKNRAASSCTNLSNLTLLRNGINVYEKTLQCSNLQGRMRYQRLDPAQLSSSTLAQTHKPQEPSAKPKEWPLENSFNHLYTFDHVTSPGQTVSCCSRSLWMVSFRN